MIGMTDEQIKVYFFDYSYILVIYTTLFINHLWLEPQIRRPNDAMLCAQSDNGWSLLL